MQKFKNNVSEGWLMKQELRLFRNFMRNWDLDVDDCDFFDIFANSNNTTGEETKSMLKKYFSLEELAKCDGVCPICRDNRKCEPGTIVDIRLRSEVDGVIRDLWNTSKALRVRCRVMLEDWCNVLERRKTRSRSCRAWASHWGGSRAWTQA